MKNLKLIGFLVIMASSLMFIQCTSEPIMGPQGLAGIDGVNGNDGSDGVDGNTACMQCHTPGSIDAAKAEATKLSSLADFKIVVKTGEGDKLFGSVSNADLSEAFAKEGIELEKKFITIAGGIIKRTGQYEASVRFHRDVISTFTFDVVAQASK